MRFSSGGRALETEKSDQEVKTACSTILLMKLAANGLQHVSKKWVERCKKGIAFQGMYFEKRDRHRTSTNFRLTNGPRTLKHTIEKIRFPSATSITYGSTVPLCRPSACIVLRTASILTSKCRQNKQVLASACCALARIRLPMQHSISTSDLK
jgi:hypothetical protein